MKHYRGETHARASGEGCFQDIEENGCVGIVKLNLQFFINCLDYLGGG